MIKEVVLDAEVFVWSSRVVAGRKDECAASLMLADDSRDGGS